MGGRVGIGAGVYGVARGALSCLLFSVRSWGVKYTLLTIFSFQGTYIKSPSTYYIILNYACMYRSCLCSECLSVLCLDDLYLSRSSLSSTSLSSVSLSSVSLYLLTLHLLSLCLCVFVLTFFYLHCTFFSPVVSIKARLVDLVAYL